VALCDASSRKAFEGCSQARRLRGRTGRCGRRWKACRSPPGPKGT